MGALEELNDEASKKSVFIKGKILNELKEKIDYVMKHNKHIKVEEWIGKILEKSEIEKVYKETKKKNEEKQKINFNKT